LEGWALNTNTISFGSAHFSLGAEKGYSFTALIVGFVTVQARNRIEVSSVANQRTIQFVKENGQPLHRLSR
jgi:hypothetical protein